MKDNIKRKDLKSNFLKTTILRLDYDYLFEEDIEQIVKKLNTFLIQKDYKMNSKTLNEVTIGFDMLKFNSDDIPININKKSQEQVSSFINKDGNIIIDITRNFSTMTINYQYNKSFDDIIVVFNEIIKQVKDVRENISLNRIGLRKNNIYFMEDIEVINKYFEESLFDFNNAFKKKDTLIRQQAEKYKKSKYLVNQNSEIQIGKYRDSQTKEEKNIYRILLDIDVYDERLDDNEIDLNEMNLIVFEIYKANLKEYFLEMLKKENFESEEIFKL